MLGKIELNKFLLKNNKYIFLKNENISYFLNIKKMQKKNFYHNTKI